MSIERLRGAVDMYLNWGVSLNNVRRAMPDVDIPLVGRLGSYYMDQSRTTHDYIDQSRTTHNYIDERAALAVTSDEELVVLITKIRMGVKL